MDQESSSLLRPVGNFCKTFIKNLQKFSGRIKKGALKLLLALSEREYLEDLFVCRECFAEPPNIV